MPRILLVDDDPDILETLTFALARAGFEVDSASDGMAALQAARDRPPAVAVLDVMLPGMNGYEVARLLKREMRRGKLPEFKVMMLTARRVTSAARQDFLATWSQADASLWKPYDLKVLLAMVQELAGAGVQPAVPARVGGDA